MKNRLLDWSEKVMITGELKNKIDKIWDDMYSYGIANPLVVIEQLNDVTPIS